jgi:hypothetical protein
VDLLGYEREDFLGMALWNFGPFKNIREMNNALAGAGGEAIVKLKIAEALLGKRIILLPVSEGGMNLKTTDINRLIETLGVKSLACAQ